MSTEKNTSNEPTEITDPTEITKTKCRFCDDLLAYGYDDEEMMHCQKCHHIWDGCAQCPCWAYSDSDESMESELGESEEPSSSKNIKSKK